MARAGGAIYARVASRRRQVVVENLLPILDGDRSAAGRVATELFRRFGLKLADLWRYEAHLSLHGIFRGVEGWEYFLAAHKRGKGVLLVTVHLGNWEFGGPLLVERGFPLRVVTIAEPGRGFTECRRQARARHGVETLVIGNDPFAFVDIIRALEAGETVAVLVDRAPAGAAPNVELFGRPFAASPAAAELARASGCALLPSYVVDEGGQYAIHTLPEIEYDRASLRKPAARQVLTQAIMRAFEPAIRQHPEQWFHFIPIWPGGVVPGHPRKS